MRSQRIGGEKKDSESAGQGRWSSVAASCREMLDAMPVVAYACDAAGFITYFNPVAEAVWGRTPKLRDQGDRYCGSHRLYSSAGVPIRHEECWMALALLHGSAYHGREIVIERHDGTRIVGRAHAHPLRDERGQIVGALNLVSDITELRGKRAAAHEVRKASLAHASTLAMINIATAVLTAMYWESATFS